MSGTSAAAAEPTAGKSSEHEFDIMDAASILNTWASSRETSRVNSPTSSRPASPTSAGGGMAAAAATAMAAMDYGSRVPVEGLPPVAYAKLAGDNFVYYVQSMVVTLGRGGGGDAGTDGEPDVDLGREKSISRKHATIQYDSTAGAFFISAHGKNGLRVGREFYRGGTGPIKLHNWSRVQIGSVGFWFILPQGDVSQTQEPLNAATQLHLHRLMSRGSSPAHTETHPNSVITSRATSPTYSDDDLPDSSNGDCGVKPPLTYAELIIDALSENGGRLSLKSIYSAICAKYVFYRRMKDEDGWKNSIRHNLSLNAAFKKTKRLPHEPVVKGNYWMYDPPADYVPPRTARPKKKKAPQTDPKPPRPAAKNVKHRQATSNLKMMENAALAIGLPPSP